MLYVTAVSMYVIPAAIACWTREIAASPSTDSPRVLAPMPISETLRPDAPRWRNFTRKSRA
jgi:hypothetical protein